MKVNPLTLKLFNEFWNQEPATSWHVAGSCADWFHPRNASSKRRAVGYSLRRPGRYVNHRPGGGGSSYRHAALRLADLRHVHGRLGDVEVLVRVVMHRARASALQHQANRQRGGD